VVLDGGRSVSLRVNHRMYFLDITPRSEPVLRALINGKGGIYQLYDELEAAAAESEGTHNSARELRAEMPGMVVEVKLAVGDTVSTGQPAIVLEAMKMQNELPCPGDGVVAEVLVKPGQSVETGALLIRLEAETEG